MKELKDRFKQLIGESVKEGSNPILSEAFVTDENLAKTLSEQREAKDQEQKLIKESVESNEKEKKETIEEGWEEEGSEVISEGDDVIFELTFLNESEDKSE